MIRKILFSSLVGVVMIIFVNQCAANEIEECKNAEYYSQSTIELLNNTGSSKYDYTIDIPSGKNGFSPKLSLKYDSLNRSNGWIGTSWELEIGFIKRKTKEGLDYYSEVYEIKDENGTAEIAKASTYGENVYIKRSNQDVTLYEYDETNNKWIGYSKNGNIHYYGSIGTATQTNSKGTFKWNLDKIVDKNGNSILIEYTQIDGHSYMSKISYLGENYVHNIDFILEDRQDMIINWISRENDTLTKRLKTIKIQSNGRISGALRLEYEEELDSRLSKIIRHGANALVESDGEVLSEESFNPIVLSYRNGIINFETTSITDYTINRQVFTGDFNGDGHPDYMSFKDGDSKLIFYINDKTGGFYKT